MPSIPPRPRVPATGGAPMATEAPRTVATQDVRDLAARVVASVEGVVVGKHDAVTAAVLTLLAGGHLLVEDVPGTGKTTLAQALARALGVRARRIQFTSDMLPTDVTGVSVFDQTTQAFRFHPGPVFSHVVIGDEVNRATPKTQSALLEAMAEGQVTIEGQSLPLEAPFMALATQNPLEQEGTYPLPEAQLDRFLFKVLIDYPSLAEERQLVALATGGNASGSFMLDQVPQVLTRDQVLALQQAATAVQVDAQVLDYAVRIAAATRRWQGIAAGAGPRGSIALVRAARACALLYGRDFTTPDDVRQVALPALRHRISLTPELQLAGQSVDAVIQALLAQVDAPRR